jgi:cold shock CspA family protein/ribosome-associated translation inhibitor RaiA
MQVPLTITYRNVPKTPATEALIRKQADKLERVSPRIISCRVAVENRQSHQKTGSRFRVRISVTVPPEQELTAVRDESEGELHEQLSTVIRRSFEAIRRQLKKVTDKRRGAVKTHPQQESTGVVVRLFREEGYGFIQTLEGREIYFHENSLAGGEFDRLKVGTSVHWTEEEGEKGPQATTVRILNKPRRRTAKKEPASDEPAVGRTS